MRPHLASAVKAAVAVGVAALAVSCQSNKPAVSTADRAALPTMERVMRGANTCWFKSGDAAFANYQLAPELNSFTGRPRILVVERNKPTGRPLLVVQAEGNPSKLDAFGPMMDGPSSVRITHDVVRWASGTSGGC